MEIFLRKKKSHFNPFSIDSVDYFCYFIETDNENPI